MKTGLRIKLASLAVIASGLVAQSYSQEAMASECSGSAAICVYQCPVNDHDECFWAMPGGCSEVVTAWCQDAHGACALQQYVVHCLYS
jgi:hypothetical protein